MSDFIFCTNPKAQGELTRAIQSIYHEDAPEVREFHGKWGALAVSRSLYHGFAPVETDRHICLIIGGPVLPFTDNRFLVGDDPTAGTKLLLDKWDSGVGISWDEDLSGPFIALRLDKQDGKLEVITDLMSFIPVFEADCKGAKTIGTHVDAVARAAGCNAEKDVTSIADFLLHGVVTYPYTFYTRIHQMSPGTIHIWCLFANAQHEAMTYWQPLEDNPYRRIDDAADALREGLNKYVQSVTAGMQRIALFLSGGEDTRVILSLLPNRCQRDAFIFVESMNHEVCIAKRAADIYGANLEIGTIGSTRWRDALPPCADLVGSGSQYSHVHTLGFHDRFGLQNYPAVFGGLYADGLLKGTLVKKLKGNSLLPFLPEIGRPGSRCPNPVGPHIFNCDLVSELKQRRVAHYNRICSIRPQSAGDWFEIWPISVQWGSPNLHGNRRLFRSYEPFLCSKAVKIAAAAPRNWRLNRRLYQRMAKPLLMPAKHLPHSNGWIPYYPWYTNCFIRCATWTWRRLLTRIGMIKGNQGSFTDLDQIVRSGDWKLAAAAYAQSVALPDGLSQSSASELLNGDQLSTMQKFNLLQLLHSLQNGMAL